MPIGNQVAQSGHAIAQWLLENPNQTWQNERLVVLEADCIDKQMSKLDSRFENYTVFKEPDLDYQITAIATQADRKLFKNLKLVGSR